MVVKRCFSRETKLINVLKIKLSDYYNFDDENRDSLIKYPFPYSTDKSVNWHGCIFVKGWRED